MIVSYSRNNTDAKKVQNDPFLYRPQFLRVTLPDWRPRRGVTDHNGVMVLVEAVLVLGVVALVVYGAIRVLSRARYRLPAASHPGVSGEPPTTTSRASPRSCSRRCRPRVRT